MPEFVRHRSHYTTLRRLRQILRQRRQLQWRNRGCSVPNLSSDCSLLKEHAKKCTPKVCRDKTNRAYCFFSTATGRQCSTQQSVGGKRLAGLFAPR